MLARRIWCLVLWLAAVALHASEGLPCKYPSFSYGGKEFVVPILSAEGGIQLKPSSGLIPVDRSFSPTLAAMGQKWDLNAFKTAHAPVQVGRISNPEEFSKHKGTRVLLLPIKMAGSLDDYRLPKEFEPYRQAIQQMIDYEHRISPSDTIKQSYCYVTVDQGIVPEGKTQRQPGVHVDGFQENKGKPYHAVSHAYLASDAVPTAFYPQPFDFSSLNGTSGKIPKEKYFDLMVEQLDPKKAVHTKPYEIYLMTAYNAHAATNAPKDTPRTFIRVTYEPEIFNRLGNTHNPLFDYHWKMEKKGDDKPPPSEPDRQ